MRAVLIVAVLMFSGCKCAAYRAYIEQLQDNLENDIGPKYKHMVLRLQAPQDPQMTLNDIAIMDDMIAANKAILEAGDE